MIKDKSFDNGFKRGYKKGVEDALAVFKRLQEDNDFVIDEKEFFVDLEDLVNEAS